MSTLLTIRILLTAMLGALLGRRLTAILVFTRLATIGLCLYYISLVIGILAALQLIWRVM